MTMFFSLKLCISVPFSFLLLSSQRSLFDQCVPLLCRCTGVSDLPAGFSVCHPVLLQSSLEFPFSLAQTELQYQAGRGRISPCGAGRTPSCAQS